MAPLTQLPRTTLPIAIWVVIVIAMMFANGIVLGEADDNESVGGWIGFTLFGIALSAVLLLVAIPRLPSDARRMVTLVIVAAFVLCIIG